MDKSPLVPSLPTTRRMPRAAQPKISSVCAPSCAKAAYKRAMRGRRRIKEDAVRFNRQPVSNLAKLREEMLSGEYTPKKYMYFTIHEKKTRNIAAPYVWDKIAQNMLHDALLAALVPRYIDTTYACLPERGNLAAAIRIQRDMKLARREYGPDCWILKMDVHHFFFSIDHKIIKGMLRKCLSDDMLYSLLCKVIDGSPPMEKPGKGLPLGNVTSQDCANLCLTPVDKCAVRFLGVKYYHRYMDDIVAILPTKARATEVMEHLKKLAAEKLELEFNEKTQVFPLRQGVSALGFKIRCDSMEISEKSKKAIKRKLKKLDEKLKAGLMTKKDVQQQVSSWLGFARWGNNFNLCKKLFGPYPYIRFEDPKFKYGDKWQKKRFL